MYTFPSIQKFQQLVELKDYRPKTKKEYVHYVRRFLQHVLPQGFQRVRYFGWLSPAAKARWQRIHTLLDRKPAKLKPPPPRPPWWCPKCGEPMRLIG